MITFAPLIEKAATITTSLCAPELVLVAVTVGVMSDTARVAADSMITEPFEARIAVPHPAPETETVNRFES